MRKKIIAILATLIIAFTFFTSTALADYYVGKVTLKYGAEGKEVKNLQNDLKNLGYYKSGVTGYFGSSTKSAVKSYQKAKGLASDGIVGVSTSRAIKVDRVIQTAKWQLGVPYVFGGSTTAGFDCSGFVKYVMNQNKITFPRTAAEQYKVGTAISKSNLKRGDLVFFETYKAGASHVGIYLGNDQFIQASSGAGKIIISKLFSNSYYSAHYIGARRVLK